LELTPETAEALRSRQVSTNSEKDEDSQLFRLQPLQEEPDPDDDWNDEIVVPGSSGIDQGAHTEQESQQNGNVVQDESSEEDNPDEDELSLSPPACLPIVLVDLERLVGYQPSTVDELEQLRSQVRAALWGQEEPSSTISNPQEQEGDAPPEEDLLASRFDERAAELFENATARHSDTSQLPEIEARDDALRFVAMDYPEYLCHTLLDPPVVLNTARVWKRQLQPHAIQVVDRLLHLLASCSRSLTWKDDMRSELVHLVDTEEDARIRRNQSGQLQKWKTERRKEHLDKLYTVRETFEHRIEIAQERLTVLERERDEKATLEIRRLRLRQGGDLGLEAFDFASTIFAFPSDMADDSTLGLNEDQDDYAFSDRYAMSDHGNSDQDGYEPDANNADEEQPDVASEAENALSVDSSITKIEKSKRKRHIAARKRRQRLDEAAKEAEHKSKLESAKADEEYMREKFTSQELKMATAVRKSLEGRMVQVESLLESLQEEEWADEEEGIDLVTAESTEQGATGQLGASDLNLLDRILAMILGSTLPTTDDMIQNHVSRLQEIHQSIVSAWKAHFGRLPPSLSLPDTAVADDSGNELGQETVLDVVREPPVERSEAMRQVFGIIDNDTDDWEQDDDDAGSEQAVHNEHRNGASPTPKVGLRPGGRV
jgi:hypothetical protein